MKFYNNFQSMFNAECSSATCSTSIFNSFVDLEEKANEYGFSCSYDNDGTQAVISFKPTNYEKLADAIKLLQLFRQTNGVDTAFLYDRSKTARDLILKEYRKRLENPDDFDENAITGQDVVSDSYAYSEKYYPSLDTKEGAIARLNYRLRSGTLCCMPQVFLTARCVGDNQIRCDVEEVNSTNYDRQTYENYGYGKKLGRPSVFFVDIPNPDNFASTKEMLSTFIDCIVSNPNSAELNKWYGNDASTQLPLIGRTCLTENNIFHFIDQCLSRSREYIDNTIRIADEIKQLED